MSTKRRIDRIKQDLPITQVLHDLGYKVRSDAGNREQQFSCDLHGSGRDQKPSARVYPGSNAYYCFACDRVRDSIALVREKNGLGFMEALQFLEKKYNFPALPWEDDEDQVPEKPSALTEISQRIAKAQTYKEAHRNLVGLLDMMTVDRSVPMDDLLPFWEGLDHLTYKVTKEELTEAKGIAACAVLWDRIVPLLYGGSS